MLESIFLEVTRGCNLRCLFCSNKSHQSLPDELDIDDFLKLVDDLHCLGIKDLRLYGGEPFLRSDVFTVIAKARSYKMDVSIYSNGTILNDEILRKLQEQNVRKLFLSVDSNVVKIHDKIRGVEGSFNQVINNIKTLVENDIVVDILLTICNLNKDNINDTYQLLHSLDVNDIKSNLVSQVGNAKEKWNELFLTLEQMRQCVKEINEVHTQLFNRTPRRKHCQAGIGELFIAANGDVFPCALFLEPEYLAGNIRKRSIKDIWEKPKGLLVKIRDVVENKNYCKKCGNKNECGGGCRARAVASSGSLLAPDTGSCIFHKEILRVIQNLTNN